MDDFLSEAASVDEEASFLCKQLLPRLGQLSEDERMSLRNELSRYLPNEDYSADFDLGKEVGQQIALVREMRRNIMVGNRVDPEVSPREVKEVVSASNTLLSTLMKVHKDVLSMERQRAIERAVMDTMGEMEKAHKEAFLSALEARLEAIQ